MTAGIMIAGIGGVVLLIAAVTARSILPAILGIVAFASAIGIRRWRSRNRL
jgi:hypothetical protein